MKAESLRAAGAPREAPLSGQSNLTLPRFKCACHNPVVMHKTLRVSSPDFQTCRIADPPKSAGREAALEVGLEICATIDAQSQL